VVQALINLSDDANRVLNIVKAREGAKDKSEAIMIVIEHYVECAGEPEFKPEFVKRIKKAEKGRFIKVKDFAKHYGLR